MDLPQPHLQVRHVLVHSLPSWNLTVRPSVITPQPKRQGTCGKETKRVSCSPRCCRQYHIDYLTLWAYGVGVLVITSKLCLQTFHATAPLAPHNALRAVSDRVCLELGEGDDALGSHRTGHGPLVAPNFMHRHVLHHATVCCWCLALLYIL